MDQNNIQKPVSTKSPLYSMPYNPKDIAAMQVIDQNNMTFSEAI